MAQTSSDPQTARYGPILGEPVLREALAEEFNLKYGLAGTGNAQTNGTVANGAGRGQKLSAQEVGITTGCNMAFLVLIMALCPPSTSSILLPLPAYFNHSMVLTMQSVKPVYIPCQPETGFKPSISTARKHLEEARARPEDVVKPRMIVLVTPNNPTGAVYSPEELKQWYDLAREFEVALVLDETYRDFTAGVPHRLFEEEDWGNTLISIGSFSSESTRTRLVHRS